MLFQCAQGEWKVPVYMERLNTGLSNVLLVEDKASRSSTGKDMHDTRIENFNSNILCFY